MNKNGGHQTNFSLAEQNLPLPPHILRIFNIKCYGMFFFLKKLALTISNFCFYSIDF